MKYIHVKYLTGITALVLAISVIVPPLVVLFIILSVIMLVGITKRRGVDAVKILLLKWSIVYGYFLFLLTWFIAEGDEAMLVLAFGGYIMIVGTFVPYSAYCLIELSLHNAMDQKAKSKK